MRTTFDTRPRSIAGGFSAACWFMAVVSLLSLGCGVATAKSSRSAYLRMVFSAEGRAIRTTASLQVTERMYPQSAWWEVVRGDARAPERALAAVIAAIKRKDRPALLNLSHPTAGRDPRRFDEQATAFFEHSGVLELNPIPRADDFDGLGGV